MMRKLFRKSPKIVQEASYHEFKYIEVPNRTEKFSRLYTAILEKNEVMLESIFSGLPYRFDENQRSPITLLAKENKLAEIDFFQQFLSKHKKLDPDTKCMIGNCKMRGLMEGGHLTELRAQPDYQAHLKFGHRNHLFAGAAGGGNFSWIDQELKRTDDWMTSTELKTIIINATVGGYHSRVEKYNLIGIRLAAETEDYYCKDYRNASSGIYSVYGAAQANNGDLIFSLLKKISANYLEKAISNSIGITQDHGHFALSDRIIEYGNRLSPEIKATFILEQFQFNVHAIPDSLSRYESDIAYDIMIKNQLSTKQLLCWLQPEVQSIFVQIRENKIPAGLGFLICSYIGVVPFHIYSEKELKDLYTKVPHETEKLSSYFKKNVTGIIQHAHQHSGFIKNKPYRQLLNFSEGVKTAYTLERKLDDQLNSTLSPDSYSKFILKLKHWMTASNPALFKLLDKAHQNQVIDLFVMLSTDILQSNDKLTQSCQTFFYKNIAPVDSSKSESSHQPSIKIK